MFWILQPATHNDYDGYSIYTDPARYPHDPMPIQPIPSPTVCSGGNSTDVRPDNSSSDTAPAQMLSRLRRHRHNMLLACQLCQMSTVIAVTRAEALCNGTGQGVHFSR